MTTARRRRGSWWPLGPRPTLLLAIVLLLAVVAYVVVVPLLRRCEAGLQDLDGSCIGVTDAGDFGDPLLTPVMARIAGQNRAAASSPGFYSIGYLVPLEPPGRHTSLSDELQHELEGVAIAQEQTNRRDTAKIKILVANAGPGNSQWPSVTAALRSAAAGPDRLRAVAGLGNSLETTKSAIRDLVRPGDGPDGPVAAIGSRLTADNLSPDGGRRIEGFFRVAPTNTDEAVAAVDLIRGRRASRPMVISDRNAADEYVASLGQAFRTAFGATRSETFNSSQDALANAFGSVTLNLCAEPRPDTVYFAGRGEALAEFVRSLADRNCADTPVDIVTGDDISGLRDAASAKDPLVVAALSSNVTVTYTGLAHPDLWNAPKPGGSFNPGALTYLRQAGIDLSDGAAIMGHDATMLAATALQRAGGPSSTPVSSSAVIQTLYGIHGAAATLGASGSISLDECGDAEGKVFPILSMTPSGTPKLVGSAAAKGTLAC